MVEIHSFIIELELVVIELISLALLVKHFWLILSRDNNTIK
ncbi:hypothetical protein BROC_00220 [Candidatus Brocadiaceae bacterium]|nr:hypothetical protein BROC_00220 [Candidatus Brocadiaceae bacterium]